MSNYISSNANRFYVAVESAYGTPASVLPANRCQATRLACHQSMEFQKRRDKTGARTYLGGPATATRISGFELSVYLTSWDEMTTPSYGPLIQAAMGSVPETVQGLVVAAASGTVIQTQSPHNLSPGSAVASGGEIRFVSTVATPLSINLNVPFSMSPSPGAVLADTCGYRLATQLPSLSLYDYWDPASSISRLIVGAGVNQFQIDVRGDVPELHFRGPAADVLDSASGVFGGSGISSFPTEPTLAAFDYAVVAGQLGQVWLGSPLNRVFTLTEAAIEINNNLLTRNREFGSAYPRVIVPGPREVITSFTLFAQADTATGSLYAAAKTRAPVSALLQLGQQPGQTMAIYLPAVVPELPLYDDSEPYLLWEFKNNLGQGVANDEAYIAFA